MIYGVDPGFGGAIALHDPDTGFLEIHDMPILLDARGRKAINIPGLLSIFEDEHGCVWLERISGRRGESVSAARRFGEQYGILQTAAIAAGRELREVTPGQWKKHFGLSSDKGVSISTAQRRFPGHTDYFRRKKDDGRAEAALIALYGAEVSK